jgi:hypothetical protein
MVISFGKSIQLTEPMPLHICIEQPIHVKQGRLTSCKVAIELKHTLDPTQLNNGKHKHCNLQALDKLSSCPICVNNG